MKSTLLLPVFAAVALAQSNDGAYAQRVAKDLAPKLTNVIKQNKYQPFCKKLLSCRSAEAPSAVVTATETSTTAGTTVSTGPYAIAVEVKTGTQDGTTTLPTRVTVATTTLPKTSTVTVSTFTRTVTREARAKRAAQGEDDDFFRETVVDYDPEAIDAFDFTFDQYYRNEAHYLAKRASGKCPTFPMDLQRTPKSAYTIPVWVYIVQYSCAEVLDVKAPEIKTVSTTVTTTRTGTAYHPTATTTIPEAVRIAATAYSTRNITATEYTSTYAAGVAFTTTTVTKKN